MIICLREPRESAKAFERFIDTMSRFMQMFQVRIPFRIDPDTGRPERFHISNRLFDSAPAEGTKLDLWYPDNKRATKCVAAYASLYPIITYYRTDWMTGGTFLEM